MADEYIKQMIDLLNEKIRNLELKKEEQRKEINRLKRYIAELKKEIREWFLYAKLLYLKECKTR